MRAGYCTIVVMYGASGRIFRFYMTVKRDESRELKNSRPAE